MSLARSRILALSATLALGTGCATSGPFWDREDQKTAERIELEERLRALETELAAARAHERELADRADALARKVGELEEDRETAVARERERVEALVATAGARTPGGDATTGGGGSIEASDLELPPTETSPPSRQAPATASGEPSREGYDQSLALLEAGQLDAAEAGFRRFLLEQPSSDLADNALFWSAEAILRRGNVAAALAGFRAVVEQHPEGNKVPDALLKVGYCLGALGEAESAHTVYRELLSRFPESPAAETARQRLATP